MAIRRAATIRRLTVILSVIFLFLLISPVYAVDNGTIRLMAENIRFDYLGKMLIATGHVQLDDGNLQLLAEEICFDVIENFFTIYRLIRINIEQEEKYFHKEPLYYDLLHKRLWVESSNENNEIIKEIIYENNLTDQKERKLIVIGDIVLTTCINENPHYSFHAARLEYSLEGVFILKRVNYLENGQNLFYLPYLAFKAQSGEPFLIYPRLGYNLEEGFFLKQTYNFYLGREQWAKIFFDLTERKGIGKGFSYTWEGKDANKVWGFVYHYDNFFQQDDYWVELGTKFLIYPLFSYLQPKISFLNRTIGGIRNKNLNLSSDLYPLTEQSYAGSLNYSYNEAPYSSTTNLDLNMSKKWMSDNGNTLVFQGNYHFDLNCNYQDFNNSYLSSSLWNRNYFSQLIYKLSGPILTITAKKEHNLSLIREYLPELKLEWPVSQSSNLNLVYQRKNLNQEIGHRLAINFNVNPLSIKHDQVELKTTTEVLARFYDSGEKLGGVRPEIGFRLFFNQFTEFLFNISYLGIFGIPSSIFWEDDSLFSAPSFNFMVNNHNDKRQITLTAGYFSLLPDRFGYSLNFSYNNPKSNLNLRIYDPNNMTNPITYDLNFSWQDYFSLFINSSFDPYTKQCNQLILGTSLQCVFTNISLNLTASYDVYQQNWQKGEMNLNYYWHCRKLSLNYNWVSQEFSLVLVIN